MQNQGALVLPPHRLTALVIAVRWSSGAYFIVIWFCSPTKPLEVQLAMAVSPPGRDTRFISTAAISGLEANMDGTTSNLPS